MYKWGNKAKTAIQRTSDGAMIPIEHSQKRVVDEWVAEEPENEIADYMTPAEQLTDGKRDKIEAIRRYALELTSSRIPALTTYPMLDLVRELWPMLDTTKASADMEAVKNIVLYAQGKIQAIKQGNKAFVQGYDAEADLDWPS